MPAGYSFRPRAWAFALAAVVCAAAIALGNWQTRRADEKRVLGERLEQALSGPAVPLPRTAISPQDYAWKLVEARGEFVAGRTVFLDNKIRLGRPGYEVVTPLKLEASSMHVLVDRGWVAAGARRGTLPEVPAPAGLVRIEGLALERLPHALEPGAPASGKVRQNLDLGAFAAESGLALQPVVIQQRKGPQDGLLRDWPRPDTGMEKNQAYALQWYSLGALAVLLALGLSFSRVQPN
jgi:surfeit locus 1 family protein